MNKKIFNKSGIAIDFGATKISVSQIIKGKFKKTITKPTSISKIGKNYIQQIEKNIKIVNQLKLKKIGIAITGRVDQSGNWYPVNKENLGTFKIPLKKLVEKKFKTPTTIINLSLIHI